MVNEQRKEPKMAMMGKVITFYSYKGGVGRSMALANVGALLAQWGYKTLVIDWDLEAPGLENYYADFLDVSSVSQSKGLIELLLLRVADEAPSDRPLSISWEDYICPVNINGNTNLSMITAGRRDEEYTNKVRKFDFNSFYGEHDGGQYLEDLREYWIANYDFILIDSRTGLTDSSGVCSIHMPEILVLIFTPNVQSFNGIKAVAQKAIAGQKKLIYDRFRLRTFPVPSRIENAETALLDNWMKRIAEESVDMLGWLPVDEGNRKSFSIEPAQLMDKIKIPYKTLYAYGEKLPVIQRGTSDPLDIGYVYETISACLANDMQMIQVLKDNRDTYIKKAKGEEVTDQAHLQSKLEEEKRKNELELQARIEEEKKKSELEKQQYREENLEEKQRAETRVKRLRAILSVLIGGGVVFIIGFIIFYSLGTASNKQVDGVATVQNDSISIKEAYIDLVKTYSSFNGLSGEEDNLKMIRQYYRVDAAYRDSTLDDIKTQLDLGVSTKFEGIVNSFYSDLKKGSIDARAYFADNIMSIGDGKNIPVAAMQSKLDALIKNERKVTNSYEKFLSFNSDSTGYKLVFNEKGNYLLDNGTPYNNLENIVTVYFDTSYKIISYTYQIIAGHAVVQVINIDLFLCMSRDAMQRNKGIIEYLTSNKAYKVRVRNFKGTTDTTSPYYINNENQVRYNGKDELVIAQKIAADVRRLMGSHLKLRENNKTVTKNYISIFICEDPGDGSDKRNPDNAKLNEAKKAMSAGKR